MLKYKAGSLLDSEVGSSLLAAVLSARVAAGWWKQPSVSPHFYRGAIL